MDDKDLREIMRVQESLDTLMDKYSDREDVMKTLRSLMLETDMADREERKAELKAKIERFAAYEKQFWPSLNAKREGDWEMEYNVGRWVISPPYRDSKIEIHFKMIDAEGNPIKPTMRIEGLWGGSTTDQALEWLDKVKAYVTALSYIKL